MIGNIAGESASVTFEDMPKVSFDNTYTLSFSGAFPEIPNDVSLCPVVFEVSAATIGSENVPWGICVGNVEIRLVLSYSSMGFITTWELQLCHVTVKSMDVH